MQTEYTHIFHEAGNGFPQVGDLVLEAGDSGWHRLFEVVSSSGIFTGNAMNGDSNYIYLVCSDDDVPLYEEYSEAEAISMYDSLPHVLSFVGEQK